MASSIWADERALSECTSRLCKYWTHVYCVIVATLILVVWYLCRVRCLFRESKFCLWNTWAGERHRKNGKTNCTLFRKFWLLLHHSVTLRFSISHICQAANAAVAYLPLVMGVTHCILAAAGNDLASRFGWPPSSFKAWRHYWTTPNGSIFSQMEALCMFV